MLAKNLSRTEIIEKYTRLAEPFFSYIPWLEKVSGSRVNTVYSGQGIERNSLAFPVYDSTLLTFVKQLSKSEMMNYNYAYIYSWNRLKEPEDERRIIERAGLYDMDVLEGILSRYTLGGMTKGMLWNQAVEEGIYLKIFLKMKELLDYWEKRSDQEQGIV